MHILHSIFKSLTVAVLIMLVTGCKVELYNNLHQQEANEMLAVLMKHNISANKIRGKKDAVSILVKESQMGMAVDILKQYGYPAQIFSDMGAMFKKEGLISSPLEERARYIYAISQDLGLTLSKLDGVLSARVHVVLPEEDKFGKPTRPSSAAVFIKHRKEVDIENSIPKIKLLVNNSIEGLDYDKITVALFPSEVLSDAGRFTQPNTKDSNFKFSGKVILIIMFLCFIILMLVMYMFYEWQRSSKMLKKSQKNFRALKA